MTFTLAQIKYNYQHFAKNVPFKPLLQKKVNSATTNHKSITHNALDTDVTKKFVSLAVTTKQRKYDS